MAVGVGVQTKDSWQGRNDVLKMHCPVPYIVPAGGFYAQKDFSKNIVKGSIVFYIGQDAFDATNGTHWVVFGDGTTWADGVAMVNSLLYNQWTGTLYNHNAVATYWTSTGQAVSVDTWYKIEIKFDCDTDIYELLVDDTSIGFFAFSNSVDYISDLKVWSSESDTSPILYFDALDVDEDLFKIEGTYDVELSEPDENFYNILSGIDGDFKKRIDVDFASEKSHEMLQFIIDNYCDFIEGTIEDDSFADWNYKSNDSAISKIVTDIMNYDYHMFKVLLTHDSSFISNPLGGTPLVTLNYSNVGEPIVENKSYAISEVRLTGKAIDGVIIRVKWRNIDPNLQSDIVISDHFPNIQSKAELQIMADSIGSQLQNQVQIVKVEVYDNTTVLQYGDIVELSYANKGIGTDSPAGTPSTYENFMVTQYVENEYGETYIEMISAFVFNKVKKLTSDVPNERIDQYVDSVSNGGSGGKINISGSFVVMSEDSTIEDLQDVCDAMTSGGTIYLKAGAYTVTDTELVISNNVMLIGVGGDNPSQINCDNATPDRIVHFTTGYGGIKNVVMDIGSTCKSTIYGIDIDANRVTVENVRMQGYSGSAGNDTFINVNASFCNILNCYLGQNDLMYLGIRLVGDYNHVYGNYLVNGSYGISALGDYNTIVGNNTNSMVTDGIYISGDYNVVTGNSLRINDVNIVGGSYNVVTGNYCTAVSNAGNYSVIAGNTANNLTYWHTEIWNTFESQKKFIFEFDSYSGAIARDGPQFIYYATYAGVGGSWASGGYVDIIRPTSYNWLYCFIPYSNGLRGPVQLTVSVTFCNFSDSNSRTAYLDVLDGAGNWDRSSGAFGSTASYVRTVTETVNDPSGMIAFRLLISNVSYPSGVGVRDITIELE